MHMFSRSSSDDNIPSGKNTLSIVHLWSSIPDHSQHPITNSCFVRKGGLDSVVQKVNSTTASDSNFYCMFFFKGLKCFERLEICICIYLRYYH